MIIHENTLVSEEIFSNEFVCNLEKCKGACCVEGDWGAPLDKDEIKVIEKNLDSILPYLTKEGKKIIEENGFHELDSDGDPVTQCIDGRDCVFAVREKGVYKCGIEKAWQEGKSDFRKPVSCHLYPIRILKSPEFEMLNYNRWEICAPACKLGQTLKVPLYVFLKEALIRKYGTEWYDGIEQIAGLLQKEA